MTKPKGFSFDDIGGQVYSGSDPAYDAATKSRAKTTQKTLQAERSAAAAKKTAAAAAKRKASDAAVKGVQKKGLKGRRAAIDNLIDKG